VVTRLKSRAATQGRRQISALGLAGALLLAQAVWGETPRSEAPARGEPVYQQLCASCHGRYGRGDGPLAGTLQVPLPDFTDPAVLGSRNDDQILVAVRGTGTGRHAPMAIGLLLQEPVLRDTIAYLRTLYVPGRHVSRLAGRDIYQASCWVCHGREGNGQGPAAVNLKEKRPRDFTSPEFVIAGREAEIERVVALGPAAAFHGSPFMPAWSSRLSPQQIQDVVEYLKTFQPPRP
jgi:mono/diheme cytochrome c family protein